MAPIHAKHLNDENIGLKWSNIQKQQMKIISDSYVT